MSNCSYSNSTRILNTEYERLKTVEKNYKKLLSLSRSLLQKFKRHEDNSIMDDVTTSNKWMSLRNELEHKLIEINEYTLEK
jgi:hypothetical protein